ncbi:hypothetical protein NKH89_23660 [Mesorhizobium sp. M0923]|uniref:hypothetical protein n=1 Tax=Mesorhizobium sp. M0923 TaxID=2957028 RepID=UPI00333543DB
MFVRTRGYSHQLIETYRQGDKVRQRIIANLGPYRSVEKALRADPVRFAHLRDIGKPASVDTTGVVAPDVETLKAEVKALKAELKEQQIKTRSAASTRDAFLIQIKNLEAALNTERDKTLALGSALANAAKRTRLLTLPV